MPPLHRASFITRAARKVHKPPAPVPHTSTHANRMSDNWSTPDIPSEIMSLDKLLNFTFGTSLIAL